MGVYNNRRVILKLLWSEQRTDVFVYLMRIVNKTNIDLEQAVLRKIKKNAEKYPVEKSRGNAKKYNEL